MLDEASWVELKAAIAPGKPANLELARDLASLALRSGLYVVGVEEKARNVAGNVTGVPLAGMRDRIDQVARDKVHPPLYISIREIEDPDRPGHGCLLVAVPATGPHMADERYWGRGDTGKRVLTDPEVRDHLARQRLDKEELLAQVRELEHDYLADGGLDPVPRLYVRAVPVDARRGCLDELTQDDNGWTRVRELASQVPQPRPTPGTTPPLRTASTWLPHDRGRVLCAIRVPNGTDHGYALQVVVDDDGPLSLIHADVHSHRTNYASIPEQPPVTSIATRLVLATANELLGIAGLLGDGPAAYQGLWEIAVRVSNLNECYDFEQVHDFQVGTPRTFRGGSAYEETATATTAQLVKEPWVVTEQLLARLVRALGAADRYLPYEPAN
jgi:hypothetical protein